MAVCWFALYFIVIRRFMHVLQLERYHTKPYLAWIKGGAPRIYFRRAYTKGLHPAAVALTLAVLFSAGPLNIELGLLAALALVWVAGHYKPVMPIKKPFVYTPRVIRLFATLIIMEAAVLAPAAWLYDYRGFAGAVVALGYLQWYMVAIANGAVRPLEGILQEGFKKKAKEKLAGKKVVGITGSYGKSGTKEAVAHFLETKFTIFKTPGSYNTPMGICKAINEQLEPHHEMVVTEMGATRKGDIKELCEICAPDIAVITSTGEAHLESFGTTENVAATKFELADALGPNGVLIINNDYEQSRHLAAEHIAKRRFLSDQRSRLITYGMEMESDFMPFNLRSGREGSVFDLRTPDGVLENVTVNLLGKLNVINITAAFAIGSHLGIKHDALKAAAATLPQMEHRLQLRENRGSYLVIDDGFNSNPVGAAVALEALGYFEGLKKILVTPGIVDLGGRQKEANFEFGKTAARYCDRVVLINRERTKPIREGLLEAGFAEDNIESFPSLAEAKPFINSIADEKSVVLFENDLPDHMEEQ
jgi:UDP-N-acetylmuramoyl-tripeptide--D-alanyl-D-alanine ligase